MLRFTDRYDPQVEFTIRVPNENGNTTVAVRAPMDGEIVPVYVHLNRKQLEELRDFLTLNLHG